MKEDLNKDVKKKILIGSNGGLTGIYLSKEYRQRGYELWGADSGVYKAGQFFVDKQLEIPGAAKGEFVSSLLEILNQGVDYYIPTHSSEIRVVSKNQEYISERTEARFLVSPFETYTALDSKEAANKSLSQIGITVPKIVDTWTGSPVVMKKDIGSGGSGLISIESEKIFDAYRDHSDGYTFYEKIVGEEYTVDCFFDDECQLIAFNNRKRIKNIGGAVVVSQNHSNDDIRPYIEKIAKQWKFKGCVNFQYILRDGIPYFIDVNLRFPSGGLPLSVRSGLDIPSWYIDAMDGRDINYTDTRPEGMVMYRYYSENYDCN